MGVELVPFPVFMVIWVGYGLLGLPLFLGRNLDRKRRYLRPHVIGGGVLFLAGMALTGFPLVMVLPMAPIVALITALNLRQIRYCLQCGATVWRQRPFKQPRFCSHCGAAPPATPGSRAAERGAAAGAA